ncbi:hypothetical protein AZE42_13033 [Rhizopogon vesiculosus]|uniref:Non-specific serine/threonine protein kinase n=1 Tax=Rhizopogon vesiculosus TaxID=180088 RepID=A0A1J8QBF2_9AGAM|nr:hypothetical protein AZE42_13033 [Rhizopogon vesiculosus]
MESLAYILIYFLHRSLPWASLGSDDQDLILQSKQGTSIYDLCFAIPSEFASFLVYARSLAFEDKPDYDRFRKLFKALLSREENPANIFDWDQPVGIEKRALEESKQETHPRKRKCESKLPSHRV